MTIHPTRLAVRSTSMLLTAAGLLAALAVPAGAEAMATQTIAAGPGAIRPSHAPLSLTADSDRLPSRLALTVGAGTPLGNIGLEYTRGLSEHFELALGVGDTAAGNWAQGAAMARLRVQGTVTAVTLGAGMSAGYYDEECFDLDFGHGDYEPCESAPAVPTLWSNAELGLEFGARQGAFLRSIIGFGVITAHSRYDGQGTGESLRGSWLPYVGLALGSTL